MPDIRSKKHILVSVVMGSDSDLPVMQDAFVVLASSGTPYEHLILSAHRTPEETIAFARRSQRRGVSVIIAGAGGAAHLPGIIAAYTTLPVIGVPIHTKTLQGVDSLYSIVQMPPGVPVATVGINGAKNAAILALEILAIGDARLKSYLSRFREDQRKAVIRKSSLLGKLGWKTYLERKEKQ